MKAIHLMAYGNPAHHLQLVEVAEPNAPVMDEVLVRMEYAPVDYSDLLLANGVYFLNPQLPSVIGGEGAGIVEALGAGVANVKVGNFLRPADTAPLAVINQMAPVYVTFSVPQRVLVDLRESMAKGVSGVIATIPGHQRSESGKVAMVENTVDMATGMVTVRGIMNNENESLWPGTLVATKLIIRNEDSVVVPTVAVQRSQSGNFVFVVKDGAAKVQSVKVDRTVQGQSVISEGLAGGESVVVDGQLLLSDGALVAPRTKKAGA